MVHSLPTLCSPHTLTITYLTYLTYTPMHIYTHAHLVTFTQTLIAPNLIFSSKCPHTLAHSILSHPHPSSHPPLLIPSHPHTPHIHTSHPHLTSLLTFTPSVYTSLHLSLTVKGPPPTSLRSRSGLLITLTHRKM